MSRSDTEIRHQGFRALWQALGPVDAERFIALVNRERFDYTAWRATQWSEETVSSLAASARALRAQEKSEKE